MRLYIVPVGEVLMNPETSPSDRLAQRAHLLEQRSTSMREHAIASQRTMQRIERDLPTELRALQQEIESTQRETHACVESAKVIVDRFQNVSKRGDLARVRSRIDAWAPEQKVSRESFLRLLEEERY